jgi:hypothetical protein
MDDWSRHDEVKSWCAAGTLLLTTPALLLSMSWSASYDLPALPTWVGLPVYFLLAALIAGVVARRARFTFEGGAQLVMANLLCAFVGLLFTLIAIGSALD